MAFKVGDIVEFVDEDPYVGAGMAERHRKRHGPGPYMIQSAQDVWDGAQLVEVDGETYSALWFKRHLRATKAVC